jgi:CcmD family protein
VEMADGFYKEGKIYIVIAVLSIVLVGIVVYLFSMDRKLKKLEEHLKNKN